MIIKYLMDFNIDYRDNYLSDKYRPLCTARLFKNMVQIMIKIRITINEINSMWN